MQAQLLSKPEMSKSQAKHDITYRYLKIVQLVCIVYPGYRHMF